MARNQEIISRGANFCQFVLMILAIIPDPNPGDPSSSQVSREAHASLERSLLRCTWGWQA
jgi:hypothetical protein